jgi:hypothetical protein
MQGGVRQCGRDSQVRGIFVLSALVTVVSHIEKVQRKRVRNILKWT